MNTTNLFIMCQCKYILVFLQIFLIVCGVCGDVRWNNAVDLNEDFRLLWTIDGSIVTFEVQVRTLGYFGLGFSRNGKLPGSDMVIGWVSQGQAYFQDRHIKQVGDIEPIVDPSQDYILIHGYENSTHTVMQFKRKLDTCDVSYDIPITNDTMRVMFMYHEFEPQRGLLIPGNLPDPKSAFKGYRSLFLIQKPQQPDLLASDSSIKTIELRNQDVELPQNDDTLHWCKMFKLQDINEKSHVVKYEPVFDSSTSMPYMQHIILYECQAASPELELMSREQGRPCTKPNNPPLSCNAIVATWAKGSEGFTFPLEAGYALNSNQARFYLMETHYNNPQNTAETWSKNTIRQKADNSGLKLYYTNNLRQHDAGVLSIGLDPNWRHIIPPFQPRVLSEGHCIEDCTKKAFPRDGISIFAVMMRTHLIGKEIKLRHIRNNEEFEPIAYDSNVDPNYQEYRRLPAAVKTMPGDRLISECIYDSSGRDQITLGGITTREESCTILTYYYPRQKRLTTCHSLPSLPTVLHSLGIQELAIGSNPVLIASPSELAGMTLESRLTTYDWKNQFDSFQQVTQRGSFKAICWDAKNVLIPETEYIEGYNPNITNVWKPSSMACMRSNTKSLSSSSSSISGTSSDAHRRRIDTELPIIHHRNGGSSSSSSSGANDGDDDDEEYNNVIESAARSKVSRSSATETMSLSSTSTIFQQSFVSHSPHRFVVVAIAMVFVRLLIL